MVVNATLCYIIKDGKVLLMNRKGGIGKGKTNAPGGKLKENESPLKGVIREVFEETNLKVNNLQHHGILNFFFGQRDEPDWVVYVFSTDSFEGEPKDGREGDLQWFDINNLPYDSMWVDDKYWTPLMLEGKKFDADFYFDKENKKILKHEIRMKE